LKKFAILKDSDKEVVREKSVEIEIVKGIGKEIGMFCGMDRRGIHSEMVLRSCFFWKPHRPWYGYQIEETQDPMRERDQNFLPISTISLNALSIWLYAS
jgi:hypothetical protein